MGQSCCCDNKTDINPLLAGEASNESKNFQTNNHNSATNHNVDHSPSVHVATEIEFDEINHPISSYGNWSPLNKSKCNIPSEDQNLPLLGPFRYDNDATYIGQYKNGCRQGFGKQVWRDGSVYEGGWKSDLTHGYGRLLHGDGGVYIGNWDELC